MKKDDDYVHVKTVTCEDGHTFMMDFKRDVNETVLDLYRLILREKGDLHLLRLLKSKQTT